MQYSLYSYKKALRVIDSCTNSLQLVGARNFCNNFFIHYSVEQPKTRLGFTTYLTDELIGKMYRRLLKKLYFKEKELND